MEYRSESALSRPEAVGWRTARLTAWLLWAVVAALAVAYVVLVIADSAVRLHVYGYVGAIPLVCYAFATVGALIASRVSANAVGWLFLAIALILLATADVQLYAVQGILVAPGSLPLARTAGWLGSWLWGPGVGLTVVFVPLLFPDGRVPGRRWRIWAWVAGAVLFTQSIAAATVSFPDAKSVLDTSGQFLNSVVRPGASSAVFGATYLLIIPLSALSVASLFVRRRHADAIVRQQLKFFMYAGVIVLLGVAASGVGNTVGSGQGVVYDVCASILVTAVASVPIAAGLAILRYHLYGIDVVISRTLVYGSLAVLITGVYVGIAVGIGELVGSGGRPNLGLSILATAIVAVGFQPARERLQRVANRLVYGKRATPYQVLSEFSSQVAGSYAADEVLPRMARVLHEGTGAESAAVWLRTATELRPAAWWPDVRSGSSVTVTNDAVGIGRYLQDVEATVYFCVLEALQNVQKYADASHAFVRLWESDGALRFEVDDDGRGFDAAHVTRGAGLTNMTDRLDALDGGFEIESAVLRGTRLRGRVPLVAVSTAR